MWNVILRIIKTVVDIIGVKSLYPACN